jgi:hypothetical protein
MPSGEAEKVQKAVQAFLVLRELKYTMLNKKDDMLPLKEYVDHCLKPRETFNYGPYLKILHIHSPI